MALITQPLRDEHRELYPHIEALRNAGESITHDFIAAPERADLDAVYEFLVHHLIPHAEAEEKALYPIVAKVMGSPQATATMSRDHVEIGAMTRELGNILAEFGGTIAEDQANDLRRVLYGLYALVKVHFAKEEEVYLPLLDARLTPTEAQEMFEKMEDAAAHAKSHAGE